jgi:hypothetical protein
MTVSIIRGSAGQGTARIHQHDHHKQTSAAGSQTSNTSQTSKNTPGNSPAAPGSGKTEQAFDTLLGSITATARVQRPAGWSIR